MTDLSRVLPNFPVGQFARLMPVLEKHDITTCDLLTLEVADIGKRTRLPLLDIRRLCTAVLDALHADLGVSEGSGGSAEPEKSGVTMPPPPRPGAGLGAGSRPAHTGRQYPGRPHVPAPALRNTPASLAADWRTISTLDPDLDRALNGGIPVGSVTEITGESGAGKTQFLLTLLLAVQLPPPHGLGRPALYLSTEAPLSTRRLAQMLAANPFFRSLPPQHRPSLDSILSTVTPDLESQDHIVNFQVPVEVERRRIGLLVIDSVAANYRAEFDRGAGSRQGSNMGVRTAELLKLGMHLRHLAHRYNLAVVVSNQVSDRFVDDALAVPGPVHTPASSLHRPPPPPGQVPRQTQESPLASRTRPAPPAHHRLDSEPSREPDPTPDPDQAAPSPLPSSNTPLSPLPHHLLLDHQQRWFTGWGDDPLSLSSSSSSSPRPSLKTPSLGLVWTTQIAARIVLFRRRKLRALQAPADAAGQHAAAGGSTTSWERHMKVVFASHAPESGPGLGGAVEFEVWAGGVRAVAGGRGERGGRGGVVGGGGDDDDDDDDEHRDREEESKDGVEEDGGRRKGKRKRVEEAEEQQDKEEAESEGG